MTTTTYYGSEELSNGDWHCDFPKEWAEVVRGVMVHKYGFKMPEIETTELGNFRVIFRRGDERKAKFKDLLLEDGDIYLAIQKERRKKLSQ